MLLFSKDVKQAQLPHLAYVCGPRSHTLEEGMQAVMGATGECSSGPHTQCSIHVDWFLLISTSDIKRYIKSCTHPFPADDNHLQKSKIQSWARCHYTGHKDITSAQVSPILSENWQGNHMELLRYNAAIPGLCSDDLIIHFISFEV